MGEMVGHELAGKVAIVTGAGSGIGRCVAAAFGRAGADVVVNDVDPSGLEQTCTDVAATGAGVASHVGDVRVKRDVAAMVATAEERFGGLDVMYANAAVSIFREHAEVPEEELDAILDINLKGPLLCAQAAIPALRARGGGSIIFVSSVQGYQGLPGSVTYAGTKAALVACARTLSVEVGPDRIRVNAIAPGAIDTPMLQRDILDPMTPEERERFSERTRAAISLGRVGRPEEIAAAATFLASDAASYVTGATLPVDGGYLAVKRF